MNLDKELIAKIMNAQSEKLWACDTNHSKIFIGYDEKQPWLDMELAILSEEQITSAKKSVQKYIRPYYDKSYLQSKVTRMCIYAVGRTIKGYMREQINQKYFDGKMVTLGYDYLKHHPAKTEYLIFAHTSETQSIPMGFVPPNSVIGAGLLAIADPTPWDIGILSSNMYEAWVESVGSLSFRHEYEYFPFPPKLEGDDELMEPFTTPLREILETGQTDERDSILRRLNDYVDCLYRERCSMELDEKIDPVCNRIYFLLALCDKRGVLAKEEKELADYNRRNILAYSDIPLYAVPILVAILNSEAPVRPSELDEYVVGHREAHGALSVLIKKGLVRRKDTPRTVINKNGKRLNTEYEAVPDYVDFFVNWIDFYLPCDLEKGRFVWQTAQLSGNGKRNPLFPELREYEMLVKLWNAGEPLLMKEIIEPGKSPIPFLNLLNKGLLTELTDKPRYYRPAISDLEFSVIAIREILSKIDDRKKANVIFKINSQLESR